jgi:hypothetical protein
MPRKYTEADFPPPNPSGVCMCGCGGKAPIARQSWPKTGLLAGHPQRFIHGHQVRMRYGKSDFSKPDYTVDENGCWVWNHGTSNGYGKCEGDYAHRVYYRRSIGPIPEGMILDHLCFNRPCVNPNHLEPVSDSANKSRSSLRTLGKLFPRYPKSPIL